MLITDGRSTIESLKEGSRLRPRAFVVFTFDEVSSYASFVHYGNAIVVPRSMFLDSKLKADFAANNHWPLADATLYGEDLGGTVALMVYFVEAGKGVHKTIDLASSLGTTLEKVVVFGTIPVTTGVQLAHAADLRYS